jgi:hypothetical protein
MNQIIANLQHAATNLHVSVPVVLAGGLAVAQIWFPHYSTQLNMTAAALAGYGIIASSNTPTTKQTPPQ